MEQSEIISTWSTAQGCDDQTMVRTVCKLSTNTQSCHLARGFRTHYILIIASRNCFFQICSFSVSVCFSLIHQSARSNKNRNNKAIMSFVVGKDMLLSDLVLVIFYCQFVCQHKNAQMCPCQSNERLLKVKGQLDHSLSIQAWSAFTKNQHINQ